jgi:DNA-binding PadR family transcriptional regulator
MSGERGAAEVARYALLGLLLLDPCHGYNLTRRFERSTALGDIMHVSPSHLYALLSRLESDGLIEGEQQHSGARPQRRVYELTGAGREAITGWLAEPVGRPRDMRIEFPLKFYLVHAIDPSSAAQLLDRQRGVFRQYIERLECEPKSARVGFDGAFIHAMRQGRIGRAISAIEWIDTCAAIVDKGQVRHMPDAQRT